MRSRIGHRGVVIAVGVLFATSHGAVAATPAVVGTGSVGSIGAADIACAGTQLADPVTLSSSEQVAEHVVGTWIRCEGPSLFGDVAEGEVGLDVSADGRYYRLFEAVDGTLLRVEGLDQQGTWSVMDLTAMNGPGSYQLNWNLLGRGTFVTALMFFESPPSLRLDEMRGSARYERWSGVAPTPGLPPGAGLGQCGHPTGPITPSAVEQVQDLLVGTWTRCGDTSVVGAAADDVGLEFMADGRFHRLVRDDEGAVVRGLGAGMQGTWTVSDTEGSGAYQVDFQVDGRGRVPTSAVFIASPPFVRFIGMGIESGADYLRGDPPEEMPATGSGVTVALLISAAFITLLGVGLRASARLAG